jgi:hypothetical protein
MHSLLQYGFHVAPTSSNQTTHPSIQACASLAPRPVSASAPTTVRIPALRKEEEVVVVVGGE